MPKVTTTLPPSAKPKVRKTGSVLDRISDIDFDDDAGIAILVYGAAKTGKTSLAATFPGPILWIVVSGGNNPGELRPLNTPEYRKKIKTVTLEDSDELLTLVAFQAETAMYKTVVLDHVTGLQDLCTSEITGKPIPAQKSWGDMDQRLWGKVGLRVKAGLRDYLGLSCNRVIIGQERTSEEKEENDIVGPRVGVALTPSIAGWLNPAVDYICQTFKKQKTEMITSKLKGKDFTTTNKVKGFDYCLRTGPHEYYTTGFRLPKGREVPDYLTDPSHAKIIKVING